MGRRHEAGTVVSSLAVLAVTLGFALYIHKIQSGGSAERYALSAQFLSANGLSHGADVDIGGVPVGRVSAVTLDPKTALAVVDFEVDDTVHFPVDSILTVGSATMSGNNALMIEPGSSAQLTKAGDRLTNTREPLSLEQQVSNYIFGNGGLPND